MYLSKLIKECALLCGYALGVAVIGYLGYHTIRWILDKCHKIEKVDDVARKALPSKKEISRKQILVSKKKIRKLKRVSSSGQRVKKVVSQKLRGEDLEKQKAIAALKIQSLFRGHKARIAVKKKKRHFLNYPLFERAQVFVNQPKRLERVPRAVSGMTPVYVFKDLPIVVKATGFPTNKNRFAIMRKARKICEKSNYSHLDIPQGRVYRTFLIESQLPIKPDDKKRHIGFYLEHLKELTESIAELTGFLCQVEVLDITGNTTDAFSTLSEAPIGRSDNITSYLVEGVGRQGLVDIEYFRCKSELEQQDALETCLNLIRLYPYHFETIISAAEKFDHNIESKRKELEKERKAVLAYFKNVYLRHLDFVKQKKIDLNNPTKFEPLSPLRQKEIALAVIALLEREDRELRSNRGLSGNSEATLKQFQEEAFPEILEATLEFIQTSLRRNCNYVAGKAPLSSYSELLSVRTLRFGNDTLSLKLQQRIASKLDMLDIQYGKTLFASLITKAIFRELVNGKEIDFYSDNFYVKTESVFSGKSVPIVTQCIFC